VLSPDGESVLTSDTNGNGAIWDARTGIPRATTIGRATAAAFDESGTWVAVADRSGVRVWNAHTGTLHQTLAGHYWITVVLFGRVPEMLVTASEDGTARVWSLRGAGKEWQATLRDSVAEGPVFSSDGKWLMTRSSGSVILWEVSTGREMARHEIVAGGAVFARDDRILLVDHAVKSPVAGQIGNVSTVTLPGPVAAESSDGKLVLLVSDSSYLAEVRNRASWDLVADLQGLGGQVTGAVFAPDSRWVMTVDASGRAAVWDIATERMEHAFELGNRGSRALVSPDGRWATAVADLPSITVWDTSTWRPRHRTRVETGPGAPPSVQTARAWPSATTAANYESWTFRAASSCRRSRRTRDPSVRSRSAAMADGS